MPRDDATRGQPLGDGCLVFRAEHVRDAFLRKLVAAQHLPELPRDLRADPLGTGAPEDVHRPDGVLHRSAPVVVEYPVVGADALGSSEEIYLVFRARANLQEENPWRVLLRAGQEHAIAA